ncbi:hypothetical protein Ae201684P_013824 [Aphanomyces euteiches]|uniref:NADH:ubiquinone oxidoreductase intermediate-associated protein 30 domain-containing protein n=1 Tax=Aphanomyces euteiches TaxID=100861 RepID=A0A6G0W691_9STRA|nr:hypothetical protein Ae201684_018333 [Aphanomyces euteiches]KAH9082921.1 hypothetical protein Ae201684P_013824 [Aphanomyces euteiches]KAH9137358.1 hypothetical protein AeRB84_017908 [Aphanomyces euteiches]
MAKRVSFLRKVAASAESAIISTKQMFGMKIEIPKEAAIFQFNDPTSTEGWLVSSDRAIGGQSTCSFKHEPAQNSDDPEGGSAVFSGTLSLSLQPTEQFVVRSGYCAIRGKVPRHIMLHGYEGLAMRIKTDGRVYRINAQADGWNPHDLYMGFLKAPPNEWVESELKFSDFILTSRGYAQVDDPNKLNPAKLATIGIALADEKEGDFHFAIDWIKAVEKVETTNLYPKPTVTIKEDTEVHEDEVKEVEETKPVPKRPRNPDLMI